MTDPRRLARAARVALAAAALALLAAPAAQAAGKVAVTWLGHATFQVTSPAGVELLVDPFLTKNPKTPEGRKDLDAYSPDALLITHSHFDHSADLAALARKTGAPVIGAFDYVQSLDIPDAQKKGGNAGGKIDVGGVTVHLVPAVHGSVPGGRPVGFVLKFEDGTKLYDTGDTWIFGDMALIQEIHDPDIILLQAGGGPYNQDPETAALALDKYFDADLVVPMHYGTWPVLASEGQVRDALGGRAEVRIMQPGETLEY